MGMRLTRNLMKSSFEMSYVEISEAGIEKLAELEIQVSAGDEVVPVADVVILAVPDVALAKVSAAIIPQMKSGSVVMTLDPAVARAGRLFLREDVSYLSHTHRTRRCLTGNQLPKHRPISSVARWPNKPSFAP